MQKYFLQDKNYILKGAQLDLREDLLAHLIDKSKEYYQLAYNPLGLMDDTMIRISKHEGYDIPAFDDLYEVLSAIYRFKHGSAQLEFLFDGMDHYSKYSTDWSDCFQNWTLELLAYEPFLKTVLQLSVFGADGHNRILGIMRLRQYVFQHFDLKIYKYKGIVEKAA